MATSPGRTITNGRIVPVEFGVQTGTIDYSSHPDFLSRGYIFKICERCNLDCPYCYMYNLGDTSFKKRPALMSDTTFDAAIEEIRRYTAVHQIDRIFIFLHGGEPLLVKKGRFARFLSRINERLADVTDVSVHVQTNGTLIDEEWVTLFHAYQIGVGVSMDGPPEVHNKFRVSLTQSGTYNNTFHGLKRLSTYQRPCVLCVIDPCSDSIRTFQHFLSLGIKRMDFLLPDYNHSAPPPFHQEQLLNYLVSLFDYWFSIDDPEIEIRFFLAIIRAIVGGKTGVDALGVHPISEVVIESDGNMQPLDMLRTCKNGIAETDCFVGRDGIDKLRSEPIFIAQLENQNLLPGKCTQCDLYRVCGGGFMPHRYSNERGFSNPSVYCETLYRLITHVNSRIHARLDLPTIQG
jgi:uncharacterized protein